ncbi:MAG: hypothetical protein ACUVTU_05110 [Desulfurispora sp.]|uniref:hypothetical protein n=1 Tax=Desulfurispora sp. TaxID=3014275 RepID=UPI00404986DC
MFKLWGTGSQSQHWQETRRELDQLRQEVAELKNELTLLRARSCNLNTLDLSLLGEQYWTGDTPALLQQPAAALEEASAQPDRQQAEEASAEPDWPQAVVGAAESEVAAAQLPETARDGVREPDGEGEAPCAQGAPQPGSPDTSGAAAVQDWAVLKPPSQPKKWWKIWVRKPTYGRSV